METEHFGLNVDSGYIEVIRVGTEHFTADGEATERL
jgi:hypothetical protein